MAHVNRVLIANRGEIAARIARTARSLGCWTIAVYSDADAGARHVAVCDTSVRIGPAPVAESYLNIGAILAAARQAGADAIHPGYGFLSENAEFAQAVAKAGLTFVGPPAAAIAAMGNKAAAKRRMIEAGVPCVPGYQGADQSSETLVREAKRIGFPIMIKAAAGGGGRGMRLVPSADDFEAAAAAARSEAERAFGSGELILEKAVIGGRHIEVQVFADTQGNTIHLGERDCSLQRRHQKVIEEAPSPAVSPDLRARMGAAAVTAARAVGYVGAGTVEFLLGADGAYYFLEMNTRLQVEHPVTEMVTGHDLVAWQLRVARGEPLPIRQEDVQLQGHAIEARLYAEDPAAGFLPRSGDVLAWRPPAGVRVDHGLNPVDTVSPFYDPMLAKLIVHAPTRDEARHRLIAALHETVVLGLPTNRRFLIDLLEHPLFADGRATTDAIGGVIQPSTLAIQPGTTERAILAALLLEASGEVPTGALAGWSSTGAVRAPVRLDLGEGIAAVDLEVHIAPARRFVVHEGAIRTTVVLAAGAGSDETTATVEGHSRRCVHAQAGGRIHVWIDGAEFAVADLIRRPRVRSEASGASDLRAPMNGRIVRLAAKPGDPVRKGQAIVVLEAMKMQHEITAPRDGVLASIPVGEGQQVATRALLAELVPV